MQQDQNGRQPGFFRRTGRQKVRPFSAGVVSSEQVEIRPKRVLRIQHINARPRDPQFEKEMQMQMLYKDKGMQPGGPLSMPRKKPSREPSNLTNAQIASPHPNVADTTIEDETVHREVSASGSKKTFTSPSNVQVALHNPSPSVTSSDSVFNATASPKNLNQSSLQQKGKESISPTKNQLDNTAIDTNTGWENSTSTPIKTISHTVPLTQDSKLISNFSPRHSHQVSPKTHPSTVLFFIHGVGGSSDVWQAQMRHFAREGYEIVAPDLIGHGMSCTPLQKKAYHFLESAADMEEIFDKYCKKRNIVIGHSYGCSFAVLLARRRSRRVTKLVLISGGAPTPLAPQPGVFSLPTCMLACLRPCLNCTFHRSAFHKSHRLAVDKEEAFSIPTYVLQHTMNGQDWADGDELYHQWLLCPTLLIYGAQDKLVKLKEEKHMEETIYRSRLEVIQDASHMVMIEAPDEVNRLLLEFLQEDSSLVTKPSSPQPPADPVQPSPLPHRMLDRSVSRLSLKSTKSHKAMPTHLL